MTRHRTSPDSLLPALPRLLDAVHCSAKLGLWVCGRRSAGRPLVGPAGTRVCVSSAAPPRGAPEAEAAAAAAAPCRAAPRNPNPPAAVGASVEIIRRHLGRCAFWQHEHRPMASRATAVARVCRMLGADTGAGSPGASADACATPAWRPGPPRGTPSAGRCGRQATSSRSQSTGKGTSTKSVPATVSKHRLARGRGAPEHGPCAEAGRQDASTPACQELPELGCTWAVPRIERASSRARPAVLQPCLAGWAVTPLHRDATLSRTCLLRTSPAPSAGRRRSPIVCRSAAVPMDQESGYIPGRPGVSGGLLQWWSNRRQSGTRRRPAPHAAYP